MLSRKARLFGFHSKCFQKLEKSLIIFIQISIFYRLQVYITLPLFNYLLLNNFPVGIATFHCTSINIKCIVRRDILHLEMHNNLANSCPFNMTSHMANPTFA